MGNRARPGPMTLRLFCPLHPCPRFMGSPLSIVFACIVTMNRLGPGARLCAGQRGTSRSSHERCDALRLVFDTAALRSRFMESRLSIFPMHRNREPQLSYAMSNHRKIIPPLPRRGVAQRRPMGERAGVRAVSLQPRYEALTNP
jgi:hypothetical protein